MSSVTRNRDSSPRGAASEQAPEHNCEEGAAIECCSRHRHTVLHEAKIMHHFKRGQAKHSQIFDVHAKCVEEVRMSA